MKSITIHGVDKPLSDLIRSKAQSEGMSINKTIKKVLEEAFGVKPTHENQHREDFKGFCGLWSETDLSDFEERTQHLSKIDDEDWK
jgi:hypothetical protein